jgi:hypothetical protein
MRNRQGPLRAELALAGPLALSLNRPANAVRANRAMGKVSTNDGEGDTYHVPLSSPNRIDLYFAIGLLAMFAANAFWLMRRK